MPTYLDRKSESYGVVDSRMAQHQQQPAPVPASLVPTKPKNRNALQKAPKGRLLITEIRIPFVWNERQYFKKRSNDPNLANNGKKFVIFCIIYTDVDMQSTQKVMVDSSMADVVFTELIEFSNVTPTTKVHLEVFSYACSTAATKTMSPVRKLSRKLTRSLTRTFGRRCSAAANNPVSSWIQSSSVNADLHAAEYKQQHGQSQQHQMSITTLPNFTKIAETILTIDELVSGEEGRSHILSSRGFEKVSTRSSHSAAYEIPLFGSFCCRTAVQPYCAIKELQVGRVNIREMRNSNATGRHPSTGHYYFCTLINAFLYAYNIDRDRRLMEMAIRVDRDTRILKSSQEYCIELTNKSEAYLLSFPNEEDRRYVTSLLRGHVYELAQWDAAALNVRDLKLRPNNGKQELRRRGSLYDEIPVSVQTFPPAQIRF